jgi:ABC-type transport system involved in multi-copper enzyme maturation permease subunit
MKSLRDALIVARFDLAESLRSRKVLVFLVLYVAAAVAAAVVFTEVLQSVETELAAQLLVARTDRPGSLTQAVMESDELRRVLGRLVRDRDLAATLVTIPPIALLYGWVALTFGPVFVILTSSDTVAAEIATGSARFALSRTHRDAWALGKLLGQAALLAVGVFLGAAGAYITGFVQLASFPLLETAWWMLRYASTSFFYVFAFLGLAVGVSQLTRSVPWSRALGLLALSAVAALSSALARDDIRERSPVHVDSLAQLFPASHRLDLWRPDASDFMPAVVVLIALGIGYFALGHVRFVRRDA